MTRACRRRAFAEERPLSRSRHARRSLDATALTSPLLLSATTDRKPASRSRWLPVFSRTWILALLLLTVSSATPSGAHATRHLQQQQQPGGGAPAPPPGVAYAGESRVRGAAGTGGLPANGGTGGGVAAAAVVQVHACHVSCRTNSTELFIQMCQGYEFRRLRPPCVVYKRRMCRSAVQRMPPLTPCGSHGVTPV